MERRKAISHIAIGIGSLLTAPAWANSWTKESLGNVHFLPVDLDATFAEIVETIIPETDTPGAKSLGVHTLLQKIVKDCYDKAGQQRFTSAVEAVDALAQKTHGKSFAQCDKTQRLSLLKSMETAAEEAPKAQVKMLKRMTIDGFMKSQWAMENLDNFEFAPARYYGCVPVK